APAGVVRDADGGAGEPGGEEVVRIAIVAGPADLERTGTVLLLAFRAILGPLVVDDLRLDTDLGPVGLDQFGGALEVRVVRTNAIGSPELDFREAGSGQHLLGRIRIVGVG